MRKPYLSYLQGQKLIKARREQRFVVRIFHPRGHYPRGIVAQAEALYCADEEIVFCVTSTSLRNPIDDSAPYTEMDWITPNELRFISSIYLCELWGSAKLMFYPVHNYSPVINRTNLDLKNHSILDAVRNLAIQGTHFPQTAGEQAATLQECVRLRYSLIPPEQVDLSRQALFWRNIKSNDHLLLRGLNALMKSDMLSRHPEFFEEATISCFIALEASFQIILRRLRTEGKADPNARDAAKWLHEHFDKHLGFQEPLDRYFAEFYDQRIMTLHPSSRFGEFPYAPLAHDDFFHLRESLRSIFAYLVTNNHDKGFNADVERLRGMREN